MPSVKINGLKQTSKDGNNTLVIGSTNGAASVDIDGVKYEGKERVEIHNGTIMIDGKKVESDTSKMPSQGALARFRKYITDLF